jgi:hypothetical protein
MVARLGEEGAGFLAGSVPIVADGCAVQIISFLDSYTVPDHLRVFPGARRIFGNKPITEEPEYPPVSEINGGCPVCTPPNFIPLEKPIGSAGRGDLYPVQCGVQWLTEADRSKKKEKEKGNRCVKMYPKFPHLSNLLPKFNKKIWQIFFVASSRFS